MFVVNGAFRGQRVTGTQRYAVEMSAALRELVPSCSEISPGATCVRAGKAAAWLWTQTSLPVRAGRSPLLSLTARAPAYHPCHVATVHDLFPLLHPEWYSPRYVAVHAPLLRHLLRHATALVTVSEPVAQDIRARALTGRRTPIVVAPNAPSSTLVNPGSGPVRNDVAAILRHDRYLLTVGNQDPRKNLRAVTAAYLTLPLSVRRSLPLVVVGGAASVYAAHQTVEDPTILYLGYVSDEELAALYAGPATLVSASLDEGFGLPLVEAHHQGCRLLVSDIPVYRWVCGDAAEYFDPQDQEAIRTALLREAAATTTQPPGGLPRRYQWRTSARSVAELMGRVTGS